MDILTILFWLIGIGGIILLIVSIKKKNTEGIIIGGFLTLLILGVIAIILYGASQLTT